MVILMHIFHYRWTSNSTQHTRCKQPKKQQQLTNNNIQMYIKIGPTSCALWPECRAVRADRLGYVQTGNCRVGQLLHMRAVIWCSMRAKRHFTLLLITANDRRIGRMHALFEKIRDFFYEDLYGLSWGLRYRTRGSHSGAAVAFYMIMWTGLSSQWRHQQI